MNPEDVANVFDEIGERVGPLGAQTAEILVRGTFAESLAWVIAGGVFTLIILSITAYMIGKAGSDDDKIFVVVLSFFAFLFIAAPMIFLNLVGVVAPDYVAIKHVLEAIAGAQ